MYEGRGGKLVARHLALHLMSMANRTRLPVRSGSFHGPGAKVVARQKDGWVEMTVPQTLFEKAVRLKLA
jgi:hypothetical protein